MSRDEHSIKFNDPLAYLNNQTREKRRCSGLPMFNGCTSQEGCSHCKYFYTDRKDARGCKECANCGSWCRQCIDTAEGRNAWYGTRIEDTFCNICSLPVENETADIIQRSTSAPNVVVDAILSYLYIIEQVNVEVHIPPRMHIPVTCGDCGAQKSRTRAWVADFGDVITCCECTDLNKSIKELDDIERSVSRMRAHQKSRRIENKIDPKKI